MSKHLGLIAKFAVSRIDGKPDKPDAEYFVLDVKNDPGALPAIASYIEWCYRNGYDKLAKDLEFRLEAIEGNDW
jgi:hypothetical protein